MGYLDGSRKEPAAVLLTERDLTDGKKETVSTPNAEHAVWETHDQ